MNPWEIILAILGWSLLATLVVVMVAVFIGVLAYFVGVLRKRFPRKIKRAYPADRPNPTWAEDDYVSEATVVGISLYGTSPNSSLEAFRAGAKWGWTFFSRP